MKIPELPTCTKENEVCPLQFHKSAAQRDFRLPKKDDENPFCLSGLEPEDILRYLDFGNADPIKKLEFFDCEKAKSFLQKYRETHGAEMKNIISE